MIVIIWTSVQHFVHTTLLTEYNLSWLMPEKCMFDARNCQHKGRCWQMATLAMLVVGHRWLRNCEKKSWSKRFQSFSIFLSKIL